MTTYFFGTDGGCLDAFHLFKENNPNDENLKFLSDKHNIGEILHNYRVNGPFSSIKNSEFKNSSFVYQCGSALNHIDRNVWFEEAIKNGMVPKTLISKLAYIHSTASIGDGAVVYPGVKIMANVKIGLNCIILPNVVINHDSVIGDFSIINSSCVVNGEVKIGHNTYLGSLSAIKEKINITPKTTIGMFSNVLSDIKEQGLYYGNPAKFINKNNQMSD